MMGILNAPLAKAQRVLSVPTTLPAFLAIGARLALVSVRADFRADALRLWGCQSFGAASAPLSRVLALARVRPAGAPPHLPRDQISCILLIDGLYPINHLLRAHSARVKKIF